jgi:hypothetical protein
MSLRLSVDEMINAFGFTYRTIDIRSAASKQSYGWVNNYAVVRLSYEEPATVEKRFRRLEKDHGVVRTEMFQVLLGQRPFSEWGDFWHELAHGAMQIGGVQVKVTQTLAVNLSRERAYLQPPYSGIRPCDSHNWPVADYSIEPYAAGAQIDAAVARTVARLGYADVFEAVNLLCELNIREGRPDSYHFYLSLPVFASVSEFAILPKEKRVHVQIRRHHALSALTGIVVFRGPSSDMGQPAKYRRPITCFSDTSEGEQLVTATGSVDLPEVEDNDWAEVQILHPDLGALHRSSNYVRMLIPPAERNILFEAVKFFCPEPDLEALLARPHEKESERLKPSAAFELHVAWLLGLFGLSTAVLGEYEHIVAPKTKVRRGSVDILAASQRHKKLVLVACTLGPPTEEDFANLLTSAQILAREVYADTNVRILPLVCTGAPSYPQYRDSGDGLTGVPVLDADRLALVLKLVKMGRERDFISFLHDPTYSELRDPE